MASMFDRLRTVRADKPPRVLIYGPPGIGKTTLASEFPNPVFLQIEDGTPGDAEITSFGLIQTYDELAAALQDLYNEDHDFQTVVIDSVTELERLVFAETCRRGDDKGNAKSNIADFGYFTGESHYAPRVWRELVEALNALRIERALTVVLIAHSRVKRFPDPETVSYDRYEIDLSKHSVGIIEREMDAIFLMKRTVNIKTEERGFNKDRAIADGKANIVMLHAISRAAFVAKNRYGMPAELRIDKGEGYAALAPYFPETKAAGPAKNEESA